MYNEMNNIKREVEAIFGYMNEPVEGKDEIIVDELNHIIKLATQCLTKFNTSNKKVLEVLQNKIEDVSQNEEEKKTDEEAKKAQEEQEQKERKEECKEETEKAETLEETINKILEK